MESTKPKLKERIVEYLWMVSVIGIWVGGLVLIALGFIYSNILFVTIGVCLLFVPRLIIMDGDGI